jgi:hypothetical protein
MVQKLMEIIITATVSNRDVLGILEREGSSVDLNTRAGTFRIKVEALTRKTA